MRCRRVGRGQTLGYMHRRAWHSVLPQCSACPSDHTPGFIQLAEVSQYLVGGIHNTHPPHLQTRSGHLGFPPPWWGSPASHVNQTARVFSFHIEVCDVQCNALQPPADGDCWKHNTPLLVILKNVRNVFPVLCNRS